MNKEEQVYSVLNNVYDPELDQPLTELGFIDHLVINKDKVEVIFRLPTYWCSPTFAYIMAQDIHKYVSELDWVKNVEVNLIDHCNSREINAGVNSGQEFSKSLIEFAGSDGELDEIRLIFQKKAFISRQERVLRVLVDGGLHASAIISMTVEVLRSYQALDKEEKALRDRYLSIREELLRDVPSNKAFLTTEGKAIEEEDFITHLLEARRTRMSMDFNSNHCRGLLQTRYASKSEVAEEVGR